MKLHYDPHQPHQRVAIDAVCRLWAAVPFVSLPQALAAGGDDGVVANGSGLDEAELLRRVQAQQEAAGLPRCDGWPPEAGPQLSVEMETGTGKTYVYLRTILELAQRHGLRKAVVVVPSVAIREGVLATLRSTQEHFAALFAGLPFRYFAYDGARLSRLRTFARSSQIEIMVLTLDAFNKDRNRMRRPHDGFSGRTPLGLVQATRPLVVLDEPQRMESPKSRAALADLRPLCTLRYSATHRRHYALVHRLTPRQAHAKGLVKRIEVAAPAAGTLDDDARISAQLRTTIERHFERHAELAPRGIKVLSLLFVPSVADWVDDDGRVRTLFRRHFDELKSNVVGFAHQDADRASAAYFAVSRKGGRTRAIDSRTGRSAADQDAYVLIMRDKERLLSLEEPVSFVVSHSALREGWDNPNIFQICTMARSTSSIKKRQEVGRGVRLAVDQQGRRIRDPSINVLTVVANDSYETYVQQLQQEDEQDGPVEDAAPMPTRAVSGRSAKPEPAADEQRRVSWRPIDGTRLRADAVSWLRDQPSDGEPATAPAAVDDPTAAITDRLLRRAPPALVSQSTIAMVHAAANERGGPGGSAIERSIAAIVEALRRQGADV